MVKHCLLALAVTSCGGKAVRDNAKSATVAVEAKAMDTVLVLYRDGAYVRQKRSVELVEGNNAVTFLGVARTMVPGTAQFRSLTRPETHALGWRYWPGRATTTELLEDLIGKPITVKTVSGDAHGTLVAAYPESILVDMGSAGGLRSMSRPVEVRGQRGGDEPPAGESRIVWTVEADASGPQTLEAAYAVTGIEWSVGYSLVQDPKPARLGSLHGWLSVNNETGTQLVDARAIVVDGRLTIDPPPEAPAAAPAYARPPDPAPVSPMPPKRKPARITPVSSAIAIADGERRQFSLLGAAGREVPVTLTNVYDPLGRKLDRSGKKPLARRNYGESEDEEVHIYVEMDLEAAGIPTDLPAGEVRVYERTERGDLSPLGTTRAFDPETETETEAGGAEAEKKASSVDVTSRKARLAIGKASQLSGRRRQTDYAYGDRAKRLVEEFRIEVRNRSETASPVRVREHLYRGLNWAIAFHNEVGKVSKTGPQEIEFDVDVPAKGKVEIMYRVVYTW